LYRLQAVDATGLNEMRLNEVLIYNRNRLLL